MKKILLVLLAILIFIPTVCYGDTYTAYDYMADFVNANPSRVAGTDGEKQSAEYLYDKLDDMGYATTFMGFDYKDDTDKDCTSLDVIGKKNATNSKGTIIIGAHYDNVFVGEGAFDNGSGVGAVLDIASRIANIQLQYDIEIIFFGAEEPGFFGSKAYVYNMTDTERERTLLMINIDSISAGDNLYFYGEDVDTDLNDYFVNSANSLNMSPCYSKPHSRDLNTLYSIGIAPYYTTAMSSDNSMFRVAGIPTQMIYSGTYDTELGYYAESATNPDIMHTFNDTLINGNNSDNDAIQKMQTVADTIVNALTDSDFANIIVDARSQLVPNIFFETYPAYIIYALILAGAIIWGSSYYRKLKKQSILNDATINANKIFKAPDAEDIFDFLKK